MSTRTLFTSESVTEGHPDKIADQVSDAVLDAILAQDKRARVACETLVKTGAAIVAGGWVNSSPYWSEVFLLDKVTLAWCLMIYGFLAAVLDDADDLVTGNHRIKRRNGRLPFGTSLMNV